MPVRPSAPDYLGSDALSSTTYYFESLDELFEGALLKFVNAETERLTAVAERLGDTELEPLETARLFRAELEEGSVAQFELYLEASRRPQLREVARRCLDLYASVAESALRATGLSTPRPTRTPSSRCSTDTACTASRVVTIRGSRTP